MISIETPIIGILIVAFFLGIKHSLDVDHIVAVSSILIRSPKFSRTFKLSIIWALGHTFTAGIITIIIFLIKELFIENILSNFEIIIALMLISIGTLTLTWEFGGFTRRKYKPKSLITANKIGVMNSSQTTPKGHLDKDYNPTNSKSRISSWIKKDSNAIATVGIIQGLASNDELFLLLVFTLGISDLFIILFGIIVFSLGVMTGMILWSSLLNLPGLKSKKERIIKYLNVIIASLAIVYGVYCLFGGEGLNLIPL